MSDEKGDGNMSWDLRLLRRNVAVLVIVFLSLAVLYSYYMYNLPCTCTNTREPTIEDYIGHCDTMCERYVEGNFSEVKARYYCEKYFEIDLNENEMTNESVILGEYGICEDRVYCFNLGFCSGGLGNNRSLTPETCRDIMCETYSGRYGDADIASEYIASIVPFGSCDLDDDVIAGHTDWWTDNFQNIECS